MSTRRDAHALPGSHCPLNAGEVCMDICQPCRFFRGACYGLSGKDWSVTCNWPRDGSYLDPSPDLVPLRAPIPDVFTRAFADEPAE